MIHAIKLSKIIWIGTAVIMVSLACGLMLKMLSEPAAETNAETPIFTVTIDPGHGGRDGGASNGNVLEKDLNLAVAQKLRDVVNNNGGAAVLTREGDEPDIPGSNGKFNKKADLEHRLFVLQDSGSDLFVSVHMNKFTDAKYSGAQVFYSQNSEDSKRLGELVQKSLRENVDNSNTREAKRNEAGIYVLKNAKVPAILVECGFLSNSDELGKLQSDEYQQQLADAIFKGIEEFYKAE